MSTTTNLDNAPTGDVLAPPMPSAAQPQVSWGRLYGSARALAIASAARAHSGLLVVLAPDARVAGQLEQEIAFFAGAQVGEIRIFPDWETLPYDVFSPHEDIVSERLELLYRLPGLARGVLIVPVPTLMQRLPPRDFLAQHSLVIDRGQTLDRDAMRRRLEAAGYTVVSQVMAHGELAVRGSIIDLYPMGSSEPLRLDLLDDEVDSIRTFDPERQTSLQTVEQIRLLPGRELPTDEAAIKRFRQAFRSAFEGDPSASTIYREVSQGNWPAGIEYYLPLFFDTTETLFDYLPAVSLFVQVDDTSAAAGQVQADIEARFEQRRHDRERPLLPPNRVFMDGDELDERLAGAQRVRLQRHEIDSPVDSVSVNFRSAALPTLSIHARSADPAEQLRAFLARGSQRILFAAESAGRREHLAEVLRGLDIQPTPVADWQAFRESEHALAIGVAPLERGVQLREAEPPHGDLAIITETELLGERAQQQRRRRTPTRDAEAVVRELTDLRDGAPVVHEEHGVGRYRGLSKLTVGDLEAEFLTLEYAGGDRLYVPVASLHLIARYTGASPEGAPLHKLGGGEWTRVKRRAAAKARDAAAELLDLYARRAARRGHSFELEDTDYGAFAAAFPFEETPDQQGAIDAVLADMAASQPMDRVVCGDVGFGKTEVAMRAAFVAVQNGQQVALVVPTTLLAQQHYQNFADRFADWPVRVEALSRFRSQSEQKTILQGLADGQVDILIGTHKALQKGVNFKRLGLVVVDEEHRFGVRHKERLKALRAEVDMLTLTATPIPRTLNMSLSGLRDLSIIATPPNQRHAIKTFVTEWNDTAVQEACRRELKRGGQIYLLHNKVETIERFAAHARALLPEASIKVAHGRLRERELEQVMLDFYHQRFNVLVCSTIIESGIDIPSANTIVIDRADKLGLAQIHQLRGRVGRSHHRAYALLVIPPRAAMTADAVKRVEAIESLEDLGVGFTLATHDLEIRGAGELLGEDQSGQIAEIGFSLYNELLSRAVASLRAGQIPDLESSTQHATEIDLGVPALIPDDYVPDVHMRLILYKRIASATDESQLHELQVEMIDRFGLLPQPARNLFQATLLKLRVGRLGVLKVEVGDEGGRLRFGEQPDIDTDKLIGLIQRHPQTYVLDDSTSLRFTQTMDGAEQRCEAVLALLGELAREQAAA